MLLDPDSCPSSSCASASVHYVHVRVDASDVSLRLFCFLLPGSSPLTGDTSEGSKWRWVWAEEVGWHQEVREEAVCWNLVRKEVVTPQQYHFTFLKNLAFFIRECISLSEASL